MEKIEKNKEKVSVVMCTYNGEKYIKEQIDSILKQSRPADEIIIQDDCSTDNTVEIIKNYQKKHSNIRLFINQENLGYNANFISAAQKATCEYIALSDQDDIWDSQKIEIQLKAMDNCLLCFHKTRHFSTDSLPIDESHLNKMPNHCLERLIYNNIVSGHTIMMKKEFLKLIPNINNFSAYYNYWFYDHILALIAESHGKLIYLDKSLVFHRRLSNSASYTKPKDYSHTFANVVRYFFSTMKRYKQKKELMVSYFSRMHNVLSMLPETYSKNAKYLCILQMKRTYKNYLLLTIKSIQLRNVITAPFVTKGFFNFCKAAFFPIYCSEYFNNN